MDRSSAPVTSWRLRAAVTAPALAFLTVFFAWPVATLLVRGITGNGLGALWTKPGLRSVAWFTLWQAVASTALTMLVGLLPAYVVARFRFPGRRLFLAFVTVPFILPTVVVGAAFLALLPERWHHTVAAILVAHVFFNVAVVVRTVGGLWAQLGSGPEEAARTLGATPWQTARHITIPLLRPALIAAASIVFLFTFTSYGVITVLGGPAHPTLEVELFRRAVLLGDLPVASALALVQLVAIGGLLGWWTSLQQRRSAPLRLAAAQRRPYGRERIVVSATVAVVTIGLGAPLAQLVRRSFSGRSGWTLAGWRAVGSSGLDAFVNSVGFALGAAAIAVTIGGAAAMAVASGGRFGNLLDAGLMLPLGTSAVTLGFGLLITFDQAPLDLRGSTLMIPIAHALVGVPFVVRIVLPVLRSIDPHLREAAACLGAPPWRVWWEVDARLAARPLLAGAGFAFAVSLGEFGATSFLTRRSAVTLPIEISTALARPGELSLMRGTALATMLLLLTAVVVGAVDRLRPEGSSW